MTVFKASDVAPPSPSTLVDVLGQQGQIPSDAIVVRGYLGRSDVVEQALDVLEKVLSADDFTTVKPILENAAPPPPDSAVPWRIYLSPRLDCYIEFNWADDVLGWRHEEELNREDAYTVWLRRRHDQQPPYRVVDTKPLGPGAGFIRGEVIEDFMTRSEPSVAVWEEQSELMRLPSRTKTRCQEI